MQDTQQQQIPQIAPDPALAQEQQQAQDELVKSLQTQAAGDTASIMARYGTRLALAGTGVPMPAPATMPSARVA
jgi:hypothetical protein